MKRQSIIRWVRFTARTAVAGLMLLVTVAGLGLLLLSTETGTTTLLGSMLRLYNRQIPGHIHLSNISGSLFNTVHLHDLQIQDRHGSPLLQCNRVTLDWVPVDILRRRISIYDLRLDTCRIDLDETIPGFGFADLIPESDVTETDETPDPFHLPLEIRAALSIQDLMLFTGDAVVPGQPVATLAQLNSHLWAHGDRANGTVLLRNTTWDRIPEDLSHLSVRIIRDGHQVTLERMLMRSDESLVTIPQARIHLPSLDIHATVFAVANPDLLYRHSKIRPDSNLQIHLQIDGSPQAFEATANLQTDADSHLHLTLSGGLSASFLLNGDIHIHRLHPLTLGKATDAELSGRGTFRISGSTIETATASVQFESESLRLPGLHAMHVHLQGQMEDGDGTATAKVTADGIRITATMKMKELTPVALEFQTHIDNLSTLSPLLSRFAEIPQIGGTLQSRISCIPHTDDLRCTGTLTGQRLRAASIRTHRMNLSTRFSLRQPKLPFEGTLRASGLQHDDDRLPDIRADVRGNTDAIIVNIRSTMHDRFTAQLSATVFLKPLKLSLARLELRHRDLVVRLHAPADIAITDTRIHISQLKLDFQDGQIAANGTFDRNGRSDLKLRIENIPLQPFSILSDPLPLTGRLSAEGTLEGELNSLTGTLILTVKQLGIDDIPLGDLRLSARYQSRRLLAAIHLQNGIAEIINLDVDVPLHLEPKSSRPLFPTDRTGRVFLRVHGLQLHPLARTFTELPLDGQLDLNASLHGTLDAPQLQTDLRIQNVSVQKLSFGNLTATLQYENQLASIHVNAESPFMSRLRIMGHFPIQISPVSISIPDETADLTMTLEDTHLSPLTGFLHHLLPQQIPDIPISGIARMTIRATGSLRSPEMDTYVVISDLLFNDQPIGKWTLRGEGTADGISLHSQLRLNSQQHVDLKLTLPLAYTTSPLAISMRPEAFHQLTAVFSGIDNALVSAFHPTLPPIDFRFNGQILAKGTLPDFHIDGGIQGYLGIADVEPMRLNGKLHVEQNRQTVDIHIGPHASPMALFHASTAIPESFITQKTFILDNLPIRARLDIPGLSLKNGAHLLPTALFGPEGTLTGHLTIDGTFAQIHPQGHLRLKNGAITVTHLNQRLRNIEMDVYFDGEKASISHLTFTSGAGTGTGEFTLSGLGNTAITGQGKLHLHRFPLVRPGIPQALISGTVAAQLHRTDIETDVTLTLNPMDVRLVRMSSGPVPRDIRQGYRTRISSATSAELKPATELDTSDHQTRLTLRIPKPLDIRGQGVEMQWTGEMAILMTSIHQKIDGAIIALPGRFQLLGNLFEIESGQIHFPADDGMDPFVDIVARCQTSEALITVTIRGRVRRPDMRLSSDPPMTQYQIVSLLLTGSSDSADNDRDIQSSATSLLLAFNNPALERQMYERLGIDRIGLGMGESGDEPILVVGKRFGRRVYVETEYHHNAPPGENRTSARIIYRITPRWAVETEYGDAQQGEVGISWQNRFDSRQHEE